MRDILKHKILLGLLTLLLVSSCDLEEENFTIADTDAIYTTRTGYEGLVNYAYNSLYFMYGKLDGIGNQELGTDLWWCTKRLQAFAQYRSDLTTEQGQNRVFWQGWYASINFANLAIYYADKVEGYDTQEEIDAKVAEAHFLRGWSYLQLVEQYGGVVLRTLPSTVTSINDPDGDFFPKRSSEEEIYEVILADLKFASENLPISQGAEKGRASRKAGLGMYAKALLQRTRLGDEAIYAAMALDVAEELIDNQDTYGCGLWESDDTDSGYAKLWAGLNNKDNKEFLFLESIDPDNSTQANPEGANRGRTRQYYEMDLKSIGAEWGTTEKNCQWYGRANSGGIKPTKYLLTEIFEPVRDPADTRFENTFFTEYYNSAKKNWLITQEMVDLYGKDQSLVGDSILNTVGTYEAGQVYYDGRTNFYGWVSASGNTNMVDDDLDGYLDGISVFTPNYEMTDVEKSTLPFLIVTPEEMFEDDDTWVDESSAGLGYKYKDVHPSFNKFSSIHWIYNNQRWTGDVPILRLGDVYLLAAEAALRANNDQTTAVEYVNSVRRRAAITSRQAEMIVAAGDVTLDFILAERARELTGEQVRWEDLKRFGKLTSTYLGQTNPDIVEFNETKHQVRPIPQAFLDAIGNAEEFGNNGY
ncbi:MAG: RagB/SusD family nutrient uptake outer membrane protein [Cyclobacteriaceae bacterium]